MKIIDGSVTAPRGFLAQGVRAQIRKADKTDLAVIFSTHPCTAAGVFTTNKVRANCIDVDRENLKSGTAQAIVANSGIANACTGEQGKKDNQEILKLAGELLNISPQEVLIASTGVIGMPLPMDRIKTGLKEACQSLSADGAHNAARAIMTTDLKSKEMAVEIEIEGRPVRIGAIAKGSGMIHPNMATMLGFITTDALISAECLQRALRSSVDISYNMVSVDRDTSTNDMVLVLANGLAGNNRIEDVNSPAFQIFQSALDYINMEMAKKIARDGEGATRLIEIKVENAPDQETARKIARSISSSNLVKTAVFGEDANWGRILAAAGYSGAEFDPDKTNIYLGEELVAQEGRGIVFDEDRARHFLQQETVTIRVDLQDGECSATAWGCDLTYDYVKINAAYRT